MPQKPKLLGKILLVVLVGGLGALAALHYIGKAVSSKKAFAIEKFDHDKWMHAQAEGRAPMADDLIRNHLNTGMSTNDVIALLGKPGDIWRKSDNVGYRVKGNMTYPYWIGYWTLKGGWDSTFVYVHFDGSGRVIQSEIAGF